MVGKARKKERKKADDGNDNINDDLDVVCVYVSANIRLFFFSNISNTTAGTFWPSHVMPYNKKRMKEGITFFSNISNVCIEDTQIDRWFDFCRCY